MEKSTTLLLFLLLLFLGSCLAPIDNEHENDLVAPRHQSEGNAISCPAINTTGSILLGVYYGNQGWAMSDVAAMENWQCKKYAVLNLFTNWCNRTKVLDNLFNQQLIYIWNNKNVPLITWEPFLCGTTPDDIEVRIASGEYDAYIDTWSTRLKHFLSGSDGLFGTADDRRVYLRLAHEMNGDWYPWGAAVGNNSPDDYKNMWLRVKSKFDAKGLSMNHVQWIWSVNHTDNGGFSAEQYYPGDNYVHWLALDGYNWGSSQSWSSWLTPAQTYDNMLGRLKVLSTKPIALTEFASTTNNLGVAAKSQWITDVFKYVEEKNIKMVTWFNEDKETDWAVYGGANGDETIKRKKAYKAYRTAIESTQYLTSDPNNARLLTDGQFQGN